MTYVFGRLIASGPLPIRGALNVGAPQILSAVEGLPVEYDAGRWFRAVHVDASVYSAGVALPVVGGVTIPGPELVGSGVYLVVTATDESGATVQVVSLPVVVEPSPFTPEIGAAPMLFEAGEILLFEAGESILFENTGAEAEVAIGLLLFEIGDPVLLETGESVAMEEA